MSWRTGKAFTGPKERNNELHGYSQPASPTLANSSFGRAALQRLAVSPMSGIGRNLALGIVGCRGILLPCQCCIDELLDEGQIELPKSLLSGSVTTPLEGRAQNSINGSDAESFAMARVLAACRGEGQWGSREEDNSKIDLVFSTVHPWHSKERMLILAQVKSGESYGSRQNDGGFKLFTKAKNGAKRTCHDICLVWVDREKNAVFWAYIHPFSNSTAQTYGPHHSVTPAMVFDLARCSSKRNTGGSGGRGIIVSPANKSLPETRKKAVRAYKSIREVTNPVLGKIETTRLGWRHMFRRSRAARNKAASLDLIPVLGVLLEQHPTSNAIVSTDFFTRDGFEHRTCEHLLKFSETSVFRKCNRQLEKVTTYIRVIEEIRYPTDWADKAMLSQLVTRRAVLKSAYYK